MNSCISIGDIPMDGFGPGTAPSCTPGMVGAGRGLPTNARVEYTQDWQEGQPPVRVIVDFFPAGRAEFWELDFGDAHWHQFPPSQRDWEVALERLERLGYSGA